MLIKYDVYNTIIQLYLFKKTKYIYNISVLEQKNNNFILYKLSYIQYSDMLNIYMNCFILEFYNNFFFNLNNITNYINVSKSIILSNIKISSSSIYKYIKLPFLKNVDFQFLRKNKVYNKGRYSRCRQNYRTGVYMCMYLSIVCIFGLYYWFFKFSFNFSYLWWFFIMFVGSFIIPKVIKYRLYNCSNLIIKFFDLARWFSILIKAIFL